MPRIYTLNDVGNSGGSKLGNPPSNRYPPSRLELEEQLKKDREKFIRSAKQLITKYHVLDEKNKCMQNDLDHSHEENEQLQNDLDHLHEENEHMRNSINQMIPLSKQLNGLNNKLVFQITCERKSHADLNAKQLKEIESLKSKNNLLESSVSSTQKILFLKDSEITSLEARINELEAELERTAQKALLDEGAEAKDSDTTQSLEIRVKELKNELEQVTQDSSFKDGLIFCLRSRVSNLEDELNQIASHQASHDSKKGSAEADSDLSSNDYKHDEVVEEVSHFSSHYLEREPDGKGDYDSISAVPITMLGGNSNTLANDQTIIPLIFLFVIFAFVVILIICYIYRRISRPTKKEEIFYPIYRNQSYGLPIRHAKEPKERITTYETLPYGYG
jgi:hypothetical protein